MREPQKQCKEKKFFLLNSFVSHIPIKSYGNWDNCKTLVYIYNNIIGEKTTYSPASKHKLLDSFSQVSLWDEMDLELGLLWNNKRKWDYYSSWICTIKKIRWRYHFLLFSFMTNSATFGGKQLYWKANSFHCFSLKCNPYKE